MIGAMWEILEFITDRTIHTNLQVNSLEDTMVDLILDAIGAIITSFVGYLYLKNISIPLIENVVDKITQDVVNENKEMASNVTNTDVI